MAAGHGASEEISYADLVKTEEFVGWLSKLTLLRLHRSWLYNLPRLDSPPPQDARAGADTAGRGSLGADGDVAYWRP